MANAPIFVHKILYDTKIGIGWRKENCYLGLCWCLWLRYVNGFGNVPYIFKKVQNNTEIGIGWLNKAGIPKFVM